MPAQVRRHRGGVFEKTWKNAAISSKDRVFGVEDVERRSPVVSVHNHLNAVSHVVDRAIAEIVVGRIWIVVRDGKRIHDPGKPAIVAHYHIGVVIKGKEWSYCRHAFADVAPHQEPTLRIDVITERRSIARMTRRKNPPSTMPPVP